MCIYTYMCVYSLKVRLFSFLRVVHPGRYTCHVVSGLRLVKYNFSHGPGGSIWCPHTPSPVLSSPLRLGGKDL